MQLSLRSQMIAGVAALGVTAAAVAPVAAPDLSSSVQRVSQAVNLVGFDSPVTQLLATVEDISLWIFDQASLPAPADLYWPDSFYTADFSYVFSPGYVGTIPDFVNQFSTGALSALVANLSGYTSAAIGGATALVSGPLDAIWNTPFALVTAAGYLAAGRPDLALAELQTQILQPIQTGISVGLQAIGYIVDNAISNTATLITNTIPNLLSNVLGTIISGSLYVGQNALSTISGAVTAALAGQFQQAWNGLVNGLLGPSGTLGQIEQLVVGVGIIEPVDYDEGTVDTVVIPSLRSDITSAAQRLGDLSSYGEGGIRNDAFFPSVPASAAAVATPRAAAARAEVSAATETAASGESAAATATESATEAATAEVTRPAAGDDATATVSTPAATPAADAAAGDNDAPAAAEKPSTSKHKATRKARAAS